jgi:iron complex transport system substrate-binding protein
MSTLAVILSLLVIITSSCGIKQETSNGRSITDMAGRTVIVPDNVDKVSTFCGCANRFLVYLGAADMISGVRASEKTEPLKMPWNISISSQMADIPVISAEDPETVIAVNADVMFATQNVDGFDFFDHVTLSERVGIPLVIARVYTSFSKNKDNFDETLRLLGKVINKEERAEQLIQAIDEIISDLDRRTKDIPDEEKPTVYVGGKAWSGSHGILSTSSYFSAFDFINAINVAAGVEVENAFIDKEALLSWDPDIIFIDASGFQKTIADLSSSEYESLKAVKNGNVYRIFPKIWCNTNYENVLVNAYYIGSILYPERFSDVNFVDKANEIYEIFLGKAIYEEMVAVYGEHGKIQVK